MSAVNEQDFANPISRRLAMGEQLAESSKLWLNPTGTETLTLTNGGMIDPERYDIARGTRLYRFASVSDGVEGTMRGGWWVERRELDLMIRYAQVNGKTLGYAVRLLCCIPPEWGSALNFIVAANAAAEIAAWRGLPNSANAAYTLKPGMSKAAAGTTYTPAHNDIAALRVHQLFIPGTRNAGAARAMFSFEGQWQTEGAIDWVYGSGR